MKMQKEQKPFHFLGGEMQVIHQPSNSSVITSSIYYHHFTIE
jgi:hypothetical protein